MLLIAWTQSKVSGRATAHHNWRVDTSETDYHMPYGFESSEGVQYSIICKVGDRVIPGKVFEGRPTYTDNFEIKECEKWKFVEGRLVHELDFQRTHCRYPLGKDGDRRFYNGVVHLRSGYVVGKVDENLSTIAFSHKGVVEIRKNNFYIIC